jgi:outer membrane protein OmpA-like peptidoglycan-associated protein
VGLPGAAHAQEAVAIRQFQPSPFSDRILRLDGPDMLPRWGVAAGLDLDYAWKPLVLTDMAPSIQRSRKTTYDLVAHDIGADLTVALGLGAGIEAGLALPVTVAQLGDDVPGAARPGVHGVGNPRIGAKARFWNDPEMSLVAGATVLIALPLGAGGGLTHEAGTGAEARLFSSGRRGRLTAGASAGVRLRGATQLFDIPVGDELVYSFGATVALSPATELLAEADGATGAGTQFAAVKSSPAEALFGARRRLGGPGEPRAGGLWLTAAAGPGLEGGYGSPALRAVLGLTWTGGGSAPPRPATAPAPSPPAPATPPPPPPAPPKCPGDPGCPDEPPPPTDRDGDGLSDDDDDCPEEAEDKDGFEDDDGCPDPDNDGDGIADAADKCPDEPETINGHDDEDGCPDAGKPEVRIGRAELETLRPVFFDTDHARVRHAFYDILGQVAGTLKAHPEIGRCAVEGHTDDTGPPAWNKRLAIRRAAAVVEFLVARGVERERLVAIGQAEKLPWASNDTEEGRARNRRVLFHIEGVGADDQAKVDRRPRAGGDGSSDGDSDSEKKPDEAEATVKAVRRAPAARRARTPAAATDAAPTLRDLLRLPDRR